MFFEGTRWWSSGNTGIHERYARPRDGHNAHSKWIDQYLRAFGKQSNKQNLYAMFELNVS